MHDTSSTGATVFVEPQQVVEINNQIKVLEGREEAEIERILAELSSEVAGYKNAIEQDFDALISLDFVFARAKLSFEMNAAAPVLAEGNGRCRLLRARHPLLDKDKAVPIDIAIGGEYDTLVITGPNTGGKTVSLKTLGLLSLMAASGLHIPANEQSEIALFEHVYADIGDEQSIEQSLSTFSAHMKTIVSIMDCCGQGDLVLFDELGLTPKKKTRSGYSTNASVLKELTEEHELPGLMLEYREYAKIKSTYIDALPRMRAEDGRVHTSFNEMVTTTGRLSSSDPNLQNIPVRTDFGRQIRTCFVPLDEGEVFVSADYSQIELRLLAHLSGDEHLIASFNSGEDFHASTASRVFGVPMDDVTPQMRSRAKAVNFGIVYGQQAYGLSQSLHIPFYEAKEMIDRYFEVHPGVRTYLDDVVAQAHKDGYAVTLFGRRRYIPELKAKNAAQRGFGERTAMNHPMQGTAADIIKLAMRQVQDELVARDLGTRLMLQVHDELDLSVPESEVEEVSDLLASVMESVVELSVPLLVDVSAGANWAEAH